MNQLGTKEIETGWKVFFFPENRKPVLIDFPGKIDKLAPFRSVFRQLGKIMAKLEGSKTLRDLLSAFAEEAQTQHRYLAFAQQAEAEGHSNIAKLFRATAAAVTVHARAHLRVLSGIGETRANLQTAMDGTARDLTTKYPDMIKEAARAGFDTALKSFTFANAVERVHAGLYQKALDQLERPQMEVTDYYVCQVCGNTLVREPDDPCEICGAGAAAFMRVD